MDYLEFSIDNYATFCIEYEKQLLSISPEVDVLCKLLSKETNPNSTYTNICK